jgi:hypothetical protein
MVNLRYQYFALLQIDQPDLIAVGMKWLEDATVT